MATTVSGLSIPLLTPVISTPEVRAHRRRRINPEAGHALEILAHAIEYVTDEYVHEAGSFSAHDPRLEAVQLLMACNREVYFACPEIPAVRTRIRALFHPHRA